MSYLDVEALVTLETREIRAGHAKESMVLFFSYGMSVQRWEATLLDREKLIYESLLESKEFKRIYWFTYGRGDSALLRKLKSDRRISEHIYALEPPAALSGRPGRLIYSIIGPFFHWRTISAADILKTNQGTGSWTALIAKLIFSKPLLFRCGYVWSYSTLMRGERWKSAVARLVEHLLLRFADGVMVTSKAARDYFRKMSPRTDIRLTPNYVDVSDFTTVASYSPQDPILFVGRLVPFKQIDRLIRACARLKVPLHVYGDGPLRSELEGLVQELQADVTFMGVLRHGELARAHHNHSFYVLCSTHEGMPKTLIEAMASGLICLGTNVEGIKELIENGVTGYLISGQDEESIAYTLSRVLKDYDPEIGRRARSFVYEYHSLERATAVEIEMIARASAPNN